VREDSWIAQHRYARQRTALAICLEKSSNSFIVISCTISLFQAQDCFRREKPMGSPKRREGIAARQHGIRQFQILRSRRLVFYSGVTRVLQHFWSSSWRLRGSNRVGWLAQRMMCSLRSEGLQICRPCRYACSAQSHHYGHGSCSKTRRTLSLVCHDVSREQRAGIYGPVALIHTE
jgi:hypothetical protein